MTKTRALKLNHKKIINLFFVTVIVVMMSFSIAFAGEPLTWKNQEYKVKGTWVIENRSDGKYLILNDEFKTRGAPDLKLFVSKQDFQSVTGKNATNGAALVAKLTAAKGAQSYKIPADIDLNSYSSLILHCEQYSKLWASTSLR